MFFLPKITPKILTDALHRLRFLAYFEQKALFFASKFNFQTDSNTIENNPWSVQLRAYNILKVVGSG